MGKDAFIATNFVLVPMISLSQGPRSRGPWVPGLGSQGPGSRVSGLRVPDPRSRVPCPGSQVLILDYAPTKRLVYFQTFFDL